MTMRSNLWTAAIVASLAAFVGAPATADIYRCKRADGTQHYTNVREKGGNCKVVVRGSSKSKPKPRKSTNTKAKPSSAPKDPNRGTRYDSAIADAAHLYHLPNPYIRAVIHIESNFNPTVVSGDGAIGLMQLMPNTARRLGVADPFNGRQNIMGGARYLRMLANRFKGDLILTTAAYNAGEGAVEKYNGIPPFKETQRYVRRVLKQYYAYRSQPPK